MEGVGLVAAILFFFTLLGGKEKPGGVARPPGAPPAPPAPDLPTDLPHAAEATCDEFFRQMQEADGQVANLVGRIGEAEAEGNVGAATALMNELTLWQTVYQEARVAYDMCMGKSGRFAKDWMP